MSIGQLQWVQIFCEKHQIHKYNPSSQTSTLSGTSHYGDTIHTQRSRVRLESSKTVCCNKKLTSFSEDESQSEINNKQRV